MGGFFYGDVGPHTFLLTYACVFTVWFSVAKSKDGLLVLYSTYTPLTGRPHLCSTSSAVGDLCSIFARRAKMGAKIPGRPAAGLF